MVRETKPAFFARRVPALFFLFSCVASAAQAPQFQIPQHIQALLDAHNYPEAEQALQSQLQRSPDWDVGHLLLGQIYNLRGRYELAEHSALSAIRIRESVDGFMVLAVATMHLQRLNESIGWLEKAANRRPDYAEIYKTLGLDYALSGMLKESEKAFRRAVELEPKEWELHYFEARALYELEQFQNSSKALQRAIDLNPTSPKAWTALGQIQERLYDPSAAEQTYRKALELCGSQARDCAWPLLQLGILISRQKGAQEAEPYFRQAVRDRPDWAKPHFYLGKTLAALGDLNGARTTIETAVHLDESRSEYHYQLAQVYRRLREPQKAEREMGRYQALTDLERRKKASADFTNP